MNLYITTVMEYEGEDWQRLGDQCQQDDQVPEKVGNHQGPESGLQFPLIDLTVEIRLIEKEIARDDKEQRHTDAGHDFAEEHTDVEIPIRLVHAVLLSMHHDTQTGHVTVSGDNGQRHGKPKPSDGI